MNAVSYLALIIGALLMMDPAELHRHEPVGREKGQIRDGMRYIWRTPELRLMLSLTVIVGTLAINFPVVLPLHREDHLRRQRRHLQRDHHRDGHRRLFGALGRRHIVQRRTERLLFVAGIVFGAAIVVASLAPTLALFLALLVLVGGGPDHVPGHVQHDLAAECRCRRCGVG